MAENDGKIQEAIASRLDGDGRMTRQRVAILDELRQTTSHPSAREVFRRVSRRLPRISFGTVYRNLKFMSEKGLIQQVICDQQSCRFDGNPSPHYHIVCRKCGRVDDISCKVLQQMDRKTESVTGYVVDGHTMEFYGTCPECQRKGGAIE